ncbi:MAG: hypothetical protein KR126chlam3_01644 [Chlamydiae bacterium]|nr:hypothetical protein [Chlamydiota bacterium]
MAAAESYHFFTWDVGSNNDFVRDMEYASNMHLEKGAEDHWEVIAGRPAPENMQNHLDEIDDFRQQQVKIVLGTYAEDIPIFCLQEVESDWDVQQLLPDKFSFVKKEGEVIAWDTSKFEEVDFSQELSKETIKAQETLNPRVAITALKSTETGEEVLVASAQITEYDPDVQTPDDAQSGDKEVASISMIMQELSKINNSWPVLIGMNANVTSSYPPRLNPLTDRDFKIDSGKFLTSVDLSKFRQMIASGAPPSPEKVPGKKTDYVVLLSGKAEDPEDNIFTDEKKIPLMDLLRSPSAHLPLVQKVTFVKKTLFAKFVSPLRQTLFHLFRKNSSS